jgi:hypothetical protein
MCLIAMLGLGAITASSASAKQRLVLKEEGVPVAVGTELGVELAESLAGGCKLTQRAHMMVNGAKKDKLTVEPPAMKETFCSHEGFSNTYVAGGVKEIAMMGSGSATLTGWPLRLAFWNDFGPGVYCVYELRKFSGTFPIPGLALVEGSVVAKLNRHESYEQSREGRCEKSGSIHFGITVNGHNNKPLETEVVG